MCQILKLLGNNKILSVLNLKSGFHQILLKDSDIEKTAFYVNNGKYEFTRFRFGFKNAPSIFQRTLALTIYAFDHAIGAVLSQDDRAIDFISRTLPKIEGGYETAKKYVSHLYGGSKEKMYTDHERLARDSNWKGGILIDGSLA